MTHFEHDFYAGAINGTELNSGWWRHVGHFQGITPPGERPETLCDAATKTHINDDPAQYYDYAIGTVIKFQLHDHIAREILKQDPRECDYYGNTKVGDFLRGILSVGNQGLEYRAARGYRHGFDRQTPGGLFPTLAPVAGKREPESENRLGLTRSYNRNVIDHKNAQINIF